MHGSGPLFQAPFWWDSVYTAMMRLGSGGEAKAGLMLCSLPMASSMLYHCL